MRVVVMLVLVGLLAAGCGDGGRRDAASATATRLLTAVRDGDGTAACRLLAPATVSALEQSADAPCAEAILDQDLPAPDAVRHVDVYGQWARVVHAGGTEFLAVFPGGWRVVAAGCQPRGDRPYQCAVEGD
ncbi:hypothetical protein [Dactylosporangium sp. NPDC000521]|uniref:hypothetical protein n=1 Tax=Dactylosporangium sp. NPDC000521 TaxID=3363975 RepID=UPI00369F6094